MFVVKVSDFQLTLGINNLLGVELTDRPFCLKLKIREVGGVSWGRENGRGLDPTPTGTGRINLQEAQNLRRLPPIPRRVSQLASLCPENPSAPASSAAMADAPPIPAQPITPRVL